MYKFGSVFVALTLTAVFSSCDSNPDCSQQMYDDYQPVRAAAFQLQSDTSGVDPTTIASDPTELAKVQADCSSLNAQASSFEAKYNGQKCTDGNGNTMDVNALMDKAIQSCNQVIGLNNPGTVVATGNTQPGFPPTNFPIPMPSSMPSSLPNVPVALPSTIPSSVPQANFPDCSPSFFQDYSSVAALGATVLAEYAEEDGTPQQQVQQDATNLKNQAQQFETKYPHVTCYASVNGAEQLIDGDAQMSAYLAIANQALTNPGGQMGFFQNPQNGMIERKPTLNVDSLIKALQ